MDHKAYTTAVDDEKMNIAEVSSTIAQFCKQQLEMKHNRADYGELLRLVLILLGVNLSSVSTSKISFRAPGAFHHARWMAKAIYCLKIYLFRNQFPLTANEIGGIRDICQFIVHLYVKAWFSAPLAASAPNHDLNFLIALYNYQLIDKDISRVALKKMSSHLWYLSKEAVGLSFFDANISISVRRELVEAFRAQSTGANCHNRNIIPVEDVVTLKSKNVSYFISKKTAAFFKNFNISTEFMDFDPSIWHECPTYIEGLEIVNNIIVVNDISERKIKMMEEFNSILTNDEEQKQFLLLSVEKYRQKYPMYTKYSLTSQ